MVRKAGAALFVAVSLATAEVGLAAAANDDPPIVVAARKGDLSRVEEMVRANPELMGVIKWNGDSYTVILEAAAFGQDKVVEFCLTKMPDKRYLQAGLIGAAHGGHVSTCRLLLDHGAEINPDPRIDPTPLELAVEHKHLEVVKFLLERGAKPNALCHNGQTMAAKAAACGSKEIADLIFARSAAASLKETLMKAAYAGEDKVVEQCLAKTADKRLMYSALASAARGGHFSTCRLLIDKGAPVNGRLGWDTRPLSAAVRAGKPEIVKVMLDHGADPDAYGDLGDTPVAEAAGFGFKEIVELLLAKDADVNLWKRDKASALHEACDAGQDEIAVLLLKHGAEPFPPSDAKDQSSALFDAAHGNCVKAAEIMLGAGVDANEKNGQGSTALHIAAARGLVALGKVLIAKGADVNARDGQDDTPLHKAVAPGSVSVIYVKDPNPSYWRPQSAMREVPAEDMRQMVELLLAHGADPSAKNKKGATPVSIAVETRRSDLMKLMGRSVTPADNVFASAAAGDFDKVTQALAKDPGLAKTTGPSDTTLLIAAVEAGKVELAKELLRLGADVNASGGMWKLTPLLTGLRGADSDERTALTRLLIEKGADVTIPDKEGVTPMHIAAQDNDVELMRTLRSKGAKPDTPTTVRKETPMHYAARTGAKEAIDELVKMGHSLEVKDIQVGTPLMWAIERGKIDAARFLLAKGADPNASTAWGRTVLDVASDHPDPGLIITLVDKGAKMKPWLASVLLLSAAAKDPGGPDLADEQLKYTSFLIDKCGAKTNVVATTEGLTALHLAVQRQAEHMVKFLLDNGADRKATDRAGRTPLAYAKTDSMKKLLETYKIK